MSGFHDILFPIDISRGATGGPGFSTGIISSVSGFEQRNINWSKARGKWNVAHGIKRREQISALISFFRARHGKAYGFRFKDWSDYQAIASKIGTGDGETTSFQLIKNYQSGDVIYSRTITKPVEGSIKLYLNGNQSNTGWSIDYSNGIISFILAPAAETIITADFEFDVPARFDTDQMEISVETYDLAKWSEIPIIEIRE